MVPRYDLEKIKFGVDQKTWARAVEMYEAGRVSEVEESYIGFTARVSGTHPYDVAVSETHYDRGHCNCFVGRQDILCKHMVALAIWAVLRGAPLSDKDKEQKSEMSFCGKTGKLDDKELMQVKEKIREAQKYIKAWRGPSKKWFAYQNSLSEGGNRLSAIISGLPASPQTAKLIVNLLLQLDKKLCTGGVDDSDGAVGGFIEGCVALLLEFVQADKNCGKEFKKLAGVQTCFDWEEPLIAKISN